MTRRKQVEGEFTATSGAAGVMGVFAERLLLDNLQQLYSQKMQELFDELVGNFGKSAATKMWQDFLPVRRRGAPQGARNTARDLNLLLIYEGVKLKYPTMKETPAALKAAKVAKKLYPNIYRSPEGSVAQQIERLVKGRAAKRPRP